MPRVGSSCYAATPELIRQLGPWIQMEILTRLLTGAHAPHLRNLTNDAGPTQQIARAVSISRKRCGWGSLPSAQT